MLFYAYNINIPRKIKFIHLVIDMVKYFSVDFLPKVMP